ncbi:MAG: hypothetical protein FWG37_04710 [Clostridia bacterium]|nr:hypothetical protein [Clostridia bacterium]
MTRRERLMATLRGEPVDRPAVCLYELNGIDQDPDDPDEYNIYNDPSWRELLRMVHNRTDRIVMRPMKFSNPYRGFKARAERGVSTQPNGDLRLEYSLALGGKTFTFADVRKKDIDTLWNVKCVFQDAGDLEHYLSTPDEWEPPIPDIGDILEAEKLLGDTGIVCVDMGDPLCEVAQYFDLPDFLVTALGEPELFHRALERSARRKLSEVKAFAAAAPGRLWRIYGPEYATAPFLPPELFDAYVVRYDKPIIDAIKRHGGYPRVHCHGNLRGVIGHIASLGCDGLDPIEPPPQGDMSLAEVRAHLGKDMVLFGNIELSEIESLDTVTFAARVRGALAEGCASGSRGFVLMHTASPIGRTLSAQTTENYRTMIEIAEQHML